jgi:hypothetical protein
MLWRGHAGDPVLRHNLIRTPKLFGLEKNGGEKRVQTCNELSAMSKTVKSLLEMANIKRIVGPSKIFLDLQKFRVRLQLGDAVFRPLVQRSSPIN